MRGLRRRNERAVIEVIVVIVVILALAGARKGKEHSTSRKRRVHPRE